VISEDRFLETLGAYLEAVATRPLAAGAQARVSAAVAQPDEQPRRRWRWSPPRDLRPAVAGGLVVLLVLGAGAYLTRGIAPAKLNQVALMVALQPAGAVLDCRIAISALSADHTTGFIDLRSGRASFTPVKTTGTTYVPALGRWADTLPQMVAPDGRSYVYSDSSPQGSILHIVDATGDRVLARTTPFVSAFAFTPSGVLLLDTTAIGHGDSELLVFKMLDPLTGSIHDLSIPPLRMPSPRATGGGGSTGYVRSGDAVWTASYDGSTRESMLWKYDLRTGATREWYRGLADGLGNLEVLGADKGGNPIVQVSSADLFHTDPAKRNGIAQQTLLLTAPHQATILNHGVVGQPGVAGNLSPLSVTEGDRTWLASDDGQVWLYTPGASMQLVAKVTTSTQGAPGLAISGPCL
jgi:hypothetical protein